MSREVLVYLDRAHSPVLVGRLWCHERRGKQRFSFRYESSWLAHDHSFALDPHLPLSTASFHSHDRLFGVMDDVTPDRWGRDLLTRAEIKNTKKGQTPRRLGEREFLLAVDDFTRIGALRFKEDMGGEFLAPTSSLSAPPLLQLGELYSVIQKYSDHRATKKELDWLVAPGSSLGGARPKACVRDVDDHLLLAKFSRTQDSYPVMLWEATALSLAKSSGISVSEWRVEKSDDKTVLLLRRFDRRPHLLGPGWQRIPFLSAMSALKLGDNERASYEDIAEVIRSISSSVKEDLKELWRRMVFNIMISNADDHLRNHGFLYEESLGGWRLSPAYDLGPSPPTDYRGHLSLGVKGSDTRASLKLALKNISFFALEEKEAQKIILIVSKATKNWRRVAKKCGLKESDCAFMASCFEHENLKYALSL